MKFWILLIAGAVSPFLFTSTLPDDTALWLLLPVAVAALSPACRVYCVLPLIFLLTTFAINERLAQRLPTSENGTIHELSGTVADLPRQLDGSVRFLFRPDASSEIVPPLIRVAWYPDQFGVDRSAAAVPQIGAGERWHLRLELRTPRGRVNFHGTDSERWYFADDIGARGVVKDGAGLRLAGPSAFDLQHWRETVLQRLADRAGDAPAFRVLAALAIADRRGLIRHDRTLLAATGTSHLLAISGLHIGLAAALGFFAGRLGLFAIPHAVRQRVAVLMPWLTAWLAALCYAALAGFGISTQRALIMLTVATVVMLARRSVHPAQAWLVAMALVLVADPFAPLRAGFWFSFLCVAVLLMLFVPRSGSMSAWRRVLLAQLGISLVMAPLSLYWFQQASLPGLLANLVAIPVVSMLIVPLVLLALALLWLPGPMAAWLLSVAGHIAAGLLVFLENIARLQPEFLGAARSPGLLATIIAMLGAALLMLPRGIPLRFLGLLLILPAVLPATPDLAQGGTRVDFLDVGQGLAVLLSGRDFQLLYDTGPGNGLGGEAGWNLVDGTIRPMISASGRTPGLVVASHADLDHAGGFHELQTIYPETRFIGSFPEPQPGVEPCIAPRAWTSGEHTIAILHPSAGLPYLGNASSCVISVRGPGLSLLLGGDINTAVERRLVMEGLGQHDLLVAPHHGSSSSSSVDLIDAVRPGLAMVSAEADNRYAFPHPEVVSRYTSRGVPMLNTARCGGIRITSNAQGAVAIRYARQQRAAIWRYPAGEGCNVPGFHALQEPACGRHSGDCNIGRPQGASYLEQLLWEGAAFTPHLFPDGARPHSCVACSYRVSFSQQDL